MKIQEKSYPSQSSIMTNTGQGNSLSNMFYDLQYFVNLDSENKICFDCGGPFPTYVSINNGVFICSNCAQNHSKLGYNVSFIHQISSPWDPYLLSYACRGGNSRFKRLCAKYEIPCESYNENDEQKLNKYIIRLGEYHRLLLRSEILADEPPKPLYLEVAKDKCNLNIIYFPEFENYHLYKGEVVVPGKQYSIGGKIWNGTKTTAGIMGTAGGIVYKVGKPVVCFLGKTAFNGIKFLGKSIYHHYYPEKDKNNKGKVISNLNYDLQYFVNLDSENKICFDCGGPFPTYVSINNGAFICSNCANNHSKLGYNISFIHQINSPWDPYLLSYACRGGNSRFKRLCAQYEVPCQSYNENYSEKLNKYLIRLGEYHRLLLRSEVLAEEPPKPLYFEVAKNKCDLM